MRKLDKLITKLQSKIADYYLIDASISTVSVGWHIEHALLTLDLIIDALGKSNPGDYRKTVDIRRSMVICLGIIPRGRTKAPRAVRPTIDVNADTLQQHILHSRGKLKTLGFLGLEHYFKHPFLGDFKLKPAIRFLSVHTQHHLNIVNDIIKSKK